MLPPSVAALRTRVPAIRRKCTNRGSSTGLALPGVGQERERWEEWLVYGSIAGGVGTSFIGGHFFLARLGTERGSEGGLPCSERLDRPLMKLLSVSAAPTAAGEKQRKRQGVE